MTHFKHIQHKITSYHIDGQLKTALEYNDVLNCVNNKLQNMAIQQFMSPKNQLYVKNINENIPCLLQFIYKIDGRAVIIVAEQSDSSKFE